MCLCVNLMDFIAFADLFGFVVVTLIYVFTFQQLSCDKERDALSGGIRKANQAA